MPDYSVEDLARAYQAAGFTGQDLRTMTAISLAENGERRLTAVSPTNDYGPSQVNLPTWGPRGEPFTPPTLFTLAGAAAAARIIFNEGSFTQWSTYNSGDYASHLSEVDNALLNLPFSSGGGGVLGTGLNLPSLPNLNPISPVTDALTNAIKSLISVIKVPIDLVVKILTWLTQSKHWWEIGFILVGVLMIGTGIILYFHNEAEDVGKAVAIAA